MVFKNLNKPIFKKLSKLAETTNTPVYLVGGYVRDLILGRKVKDIDVVVAGNGIAFATEFAKSIAGSKLSVFKNFGTAMVKTPDTEIEFVGARKESYNSQSRNPVVENGSLQDDQLRRDFTINAMAISLNKNDFGTLIDPFEGKKHLSEKIIKTPLNPLQTFSDDPLRMMRAIRFATQLNFKIHDDTYQGIIQSKDRIKIISKERITEELNKIILSPKPSIGFKLLYNSGILKIIFPELEAMKGVEVKENKAHKDNFYHTLMVLDNICKETDNLWLRWAALLHDIGKPLTKKFIPSEGGWTFHGHEDKGSKMIAPIFRKLKLPLNEKLNYVEKIVALHHRPKVLANEGVTDSAIRRLIVDAGECLDDLFILCRADMTSSNPEKIALYRENLKKVEQMVEEVAERDALRNWQPPITGEIIMQTFNIKPGREVGLIKNTIREAILDGIIKNNFNDAFQFMIEVAKKMNLNLETDNTNQTKK